MVDKGCQHSKLRLSMFALACLLFTTTGCQVAAVHVTPDDIDGIKDARYVLSDPVRDPYERFNRKVFEFNSWLDARFLRPVAVVYRNALPEPLRTSVSNFFSNLDYPLVAMNQFLQGKPVLGFRDVTRFGINSTLGVAGFFDVATGMGFVEHNEDFGQTLSVWGIPEGPFAVAPLIGPGATVDFVNTLTVVFVDAGNLISEPGFRYSVRGLEGISGRAGALGFEQLQFGDPYIFQRDAYLQRRDFLVRDGEAEQSDGFLSEEDDFLFE